jgi:serine/threonine protein kinase/tetratricopeptide (TPR) repeat protein
MIGKIVSHYTILENLGAGGMGVVYKARDLRLDRPVALKFLPPEMVRESEARQRFIQEAKAASALDHQNICVVHEIGETEDGQVFIVMAYYEGETLKTKIERGPLKVEDAVSIAIQVAQGLTKAHRHGIVHRDIKPANIILTADGIAKIVDFGLAKLAGQTLLTVAGSTIGTAAYMSPEQARGEAVDHRTDIWSLGVVLYEMIAGQRPFRSDYEQALIYLIINEEPESLAKIRPDTDPALAQIVGHALVKQAGSRYQTMEEFREDLVAVAGGLQPAKARARPSGGKLAVLPFANLTGDPDQEFLSDGLTQEMIAHLGRLSPHSLSVIARTSVMRYKRTDTPIDQIGRELGIDYALEGSVQREGTRVRIIAELIHVRDQSQLWTEIFEQEMSGILALQNDVAEKVAGALAIKLLPSEQARLASAHTVDPEAYEAYLKGRFHWYKLSAEHLDTAYDYFQLALQKHPDYALAHAGIASVLSSRADCGLVPPRDVLPRMRAAAMKALELDDTLAEVHSILGNFRFCNEWNFPGAEAAFRRAIQLNPNSADAHFFFSDFLISMHRSQEWKGEIERTLDLDPVNFFVQCFLGWHLVYLHRYDEAITQLQKVLRTEPDFASAHLGLWGAFYRSRMYEEALEEAKKFFAVLGDRHVEEALTEGYAMDGYAGAMRLAAEKLAERSAISYAPAFRIARLFAQARERTRAQEWLEKAYEHRESPLVHLSVGWDWDSLREEPHFQDLLRRIGLPDQVQEPKHH